MCTKHVEEYNKLFYKTRICALSCSITKIILRRTVGKTLKIINYEGCDCNTVTQRGTNFFQKFGNHLEILGAGRVT